MSMWFHKFAEETNIDIDDEGQEASALTPAAKPPASLLVLEGEAVDIGGDGGELAAYQVVYHSVNFSSTFFYISLSTSSVRYFSNS